MQFVHLPAPYPQYQPGAFDLDNDDPFAIAQRGAADHPQVSTRGAGLRPPAAEQRGAYQNHGNHQRQGSSGLAQHGHARQGVAAYGERVHIECIHGVGALGGGGSTHRLSFWTRSEGVMISVIRIPYFSSTTTTSPWAIR